MRAVSIVLTIVLTACIPPRRAGVGTECEVNSECAAPLVCRLGHCRNECATSADCPSGTSCVLDHNDFGACQLAAETSCTVASECPEGLVCRFEQCTNDCETDRDCAGGARCLESPMGRACFDPSSEGCNFDGECGPDPESGTTTRCVGGRCRRECFTDRDCRNDFWCNGDEGGVCWPLPRLASRDAGVAPDGGTPAGCLPTAPLWTASMAGIDATSIVAAAPPYLVLSSVDDPSTPGGQLHVLALDAPHAWIEVPFTEARQGMSAAPSTTGPQLYITGGSVSTGDGDPFTGVATYSPPSAMPFLLTLDTSEARRGSTAFVCNTNLVVAGGTRFSPDEHLVDAVDVLELTAFGRELLTTMPAPHRGMGAATRFAGALLAGGERETSPGVFEPSDALYELDCITPAITERTLPRRYRRTWALSSGDRSYFVGDAEPASGEGPYDHVDVYDWGAGSVSSFDAPPPSGAGALNDVVLVGARLVRSFGNVVQGIDELGGGLGGCLSPEIRADRLATDGFLLYVITFESGSAIVSAFDPP